MLDITQHRTPEQWQIEANKLKHTIYNGGTLLEKEQALILYTHCVVFAELAERKLIPTVNVITEQTIS